MAVHKRWKKKSFQMSQVQNHLMLFKGLIKLSQQLNFLASESGSEVTQSYSTLYDPMCCSLLGSSIHGIF